MSDELRAAYLMLEITKAQCRIAQSYARIEGMKAENTHRTECGNSIAYCEDAFNNECSDLASTLQALQSL